MFLKILKEFNVESKLLKKLRMTVDEEVKNILFLQLLQIDENGIDFRIAKNKRYYMYPPYGLGILASHAKNKNFNTRLVDLNYEVFNNLQKSEKQVTPEDIKNIWAKKLYNELKSFKPDLVCLSCMFTMSHKMLGDVSSYIKSVLPNVPILAGGVHVTNAPKKVLRDSPDIDFVGLYEFDIAFCNFLNFIKNPEDDGSKLTQIAAIIDGKYSSLKKIIRPSDDELNISPFYDDLNIGNFTNLGEIGTFRYWRPPSSKGTSVLSNRGCRARCTFCSVANFNGRGVRGRSVESVVDEIQALKENHGINHITWLDDDLFFRPSRALKLFNEIENRNLDITWDASNGIIASAAVVHEELVAAAEASGCIGMYFGIESGNDKILRKVKKPSSVKHFLRLGEMMKKYPKIFTRGFLMMGFPGETLSQINDTINLAVEMNLDWSTIQLLTPLPSTPIYNEMVEEGYIEKDSLNTDGEGYTMFSVRESERQRRKELNGVEESYFENMFSGKLNVVPTKTQLNELWFVVDYLINYQRIISMEDKLKLQKMKLFLEDVSDRMTINNPISNLFLGMVDQKLGDSDSAATRINNSRIFVENSDYWQSRFDEMNLVKYILPYRGD